MLLVRFIPEAPGSQLVWHDQKILRHRFVPRPLSVITRTCNRHFVDYTDMRRLTTGIRPEKCVVRRLRRCANVIECT